MTDRNQIPVTTLIVFGFIFATLGMGLEGLLAFLFLILAMVLFIVAMVYSKNGKKQTSKTDQ